MLFLRDNTVQALIKWIYGKYIRYLCISKMQIYIKMLNVCLEFIVKVGTLVDVHLIKSGVISMDRMIYLCTPITYFVICN